MHDDIRPARADDVSQIVTMLDAAAAERHAFWPDVWHRDPKDITRMTEALQHRLAEPTTAQSIWLVAARNDRLVGVSHAMPLPVPPIYAAALGAPGLIMDDCIVTPQAAAGTHAALLHATERALRDAGAQVLLASSPEGAANATLTEAEGFAPLTLFMAKKLDQPIAATEDIRLAEPGDIAEIVAMTQAKLAQTAALHPFWTAHPEANARFESWMQKSLTLTDRDMLVAGATGALTGYVIAQPIARLLVPGQHDIGKIGVFDDFHAADFAPGSKGAEVAAALLRAGEAALMARGYSAAVAVCPAAWASKKAFLAQAGYRVMKQWRIKT